MRELDAHANQLAHHLRGARRRAPRCMVGLCVERSPEMVVGLLGILKAGGAYLPLDPDYPARAAGASCSADAGAAVLVTQQALLERLPSAAAQPRPHRAARCRLGRDRAPAAPRARSSTLSTRNNPAYVIYTSGSTGTPKGVVVDARGHCQLWRGRIDDLNCCE